jgi:hypothetical protein
MTLMTNLYAQIMPFVMLGTKLTTSLSELAPFVGGFVKEIGRMGEEAGKAALATTAQLPVISLKEAQQKALYECEVARQFLTSVDSKPWHSKGSVGRSDLRTLQCMKSMYSFILKGSFESHEFQRI